jgi:hypothetical protein
VLDEPHRLVGLPQAAQMAGKMVGHPAVEPCPHVEHPQPIDQKVGQLAGPLGQVAGPRLPLRVAGEQQRILDLDHRRARARGDDHRAVTGKDPQRVFGLFARQVMKTAIKQGLPATGLRLGKIDLVPEAAEQTNRGLPGFGAQHVSQAGDHQGKLHARLSAPVKGRESGTRE